jgi:hypothetical protein
MATEKPKLLLSTSRRGRSVASVVHVMPPSVLRRTTAMPLPDTGVPVRPEVAVGEPTTTRSASAPLPSWHATAEPNCPPAVSVGAESFSIRW